MKAQIVEQIELFSEVELESLEFLPEELEAIEEERVPDLESISLDEVAKDLEAYFVEELEDLENTELEKFSFLKRFVKRGRRGGKQAVPRGHQHGEQEIRCYPTSDCRGKNWKMRSTHNCCGKNRSGSYRIVRTGECRSCRNG